MWANIFGPRTPAPGNDFDGGVGRLLARRLRHAVGDRLRCFVHDRARGANARLAEQLFKSVSDEALLTPPGILQRHPEPIRYHAVRRRRRVGGGQHDAAAQCECQQCPATAAKRSRGWRSSACGAGNAVPP